MTTGRRYWKKNGLLLSKVKASNPRVMVCVDLVDSLTAETPSKSQSMLAFSIIHLAIDCFEIVEATKKTRNSP
jgi:putative NIF3 family GTP cyclohydrolase 1 type 2